MIADRDIILRCQRGQTHLLDVLIERYKVALYSLCRKLTRNSADADDLFQDTWVRVMKNIARFSPERRFSPWLFTICVNGYRDRYRKRGRWSRLIPSFRSSTIRDAVIDRTPAPESGPEEDLLRDESARGVRRALSGLHDTLRLPLLLHYYRDLSLEEISQILGIPTGTAKSRLHRGRAMVRSLMEDENHE